MKLDVDEVMHRVMTELEQRRAASPPAEAEASRSGPPILRPWASAVPGLVEKPAYALGELLVHSDRTFVQNAYQALLRRPADQEGMEGYLSYLRSGALTKVDVLGSLRWSAEGEIQGVHVDGLLVPYTLQKWKRKPLIGPVLSWVHALTRLPAIVRRQNLSDAVHSREEHELGRFANELSIAMDQRIAEVRNEVAFERLQRTDLHNRNATEAAGRDHRWQQSVDSIGSRLDEAEMGLGELRQAAGTHSEMAALLTRFGQELVTLRETVENQTQVSERRAVGMEARINGLEERTGQLAASRQEKNTLNDLDSFYVAFEEEFRGSRELVRGRVLPYLDVIRDANVGTHATPILDIGCGRGDWLDILREHNFVARGIDSNKIFVELCRGRGLEVTERDMIDALRDLPDGSIGAVTGLHIAEHLPFEVLIELLDQCKRVLCIGGILILETPNPENIQVATHFFYMDPTHRNPLPPSALRWIVEARGFERVRIERLTEARPLPAPSLAHGDVAAADSLNFLLAQYLAAPDYAIVARRL